MKNMNITQMEKYIEMTFELIFTNSDWVKKCIKECEGNHVQQIAYSSYHDAFTQICFGCKKIRTSMRKEDAEDKENGIK